MPGRVGERTEEDGRNGASIGALERKYRTERRKYKNVNLIPGCVCSDLFVKKRRFLPETYNWLH